MHGWVVVIPDHLVTWCVSFLHFPVSHRIADQEWAKNFDALIGPFEGQYADLKVSIAGIYDEAKDKYVGALQCLVRTTCLFVWDYR